MPDRIDLFPVNIHRIGDGLKGIKADTQGEKESQHRNRVKIGNSQKVEQLIIALQDKSGIFKKSEQPEVCNDIERGVIDIKSIVYFLSLTALFLYLNAKALERRKY